MSLLHAAVRPTTVTIDLVQSLSFYVLTRELSTLDRSCTKM